MYTGLKHLHSFWPYLLLPILIAAIVIFIVKRSQKKEFSNSDKRLAVASLALSHVQLVIGLILYFVSPVVKAALNSGAVMSDAANRFHAVEHISTMIIAIILITVGYSRAKRLTNAASKYKSLILFYSLGLLLILSRIPWDVWPGW